MDFHLSECGLELVSCTNYSKQQIGSFKPEGCIHCDLPVCLSSVVLGGI